MKKVSLGYFSAILCCCVVSSLVEAACPPLPLLQNGNYRITDKSGDKVKIACDLSYEYVHPVYPSRRSTVVTCRRGRWDDPEPICHRKPDICLPPPAPENGIVIGLEPYEGDGVAHFHCNEGYYRKGPDQAKCQYQNYEWSSDPPLCIKYDPTSITGITDQLNKQFVENMQQYSSGFGRQIDYDAEREGLDLFLVFDKSSSIPPPSFAQGIEFAKFLVGKFNVTNGGKDIVGGTRLTVITFGSAIKKEIDMTDKAIASTEAAIKRIGEIKCGPVSCDGGTNMAEALSSVDYAVKKQIRPQAKKALFITSDGEPTYEPGQKPVSYYINSLKENDVEIFTVGVGNDVNEEFLATLASRPAEEHVFSLEKFEDFGTIVTIIREKTAEGPAPAADKCGYVDKRFEQNISSIVDGDVKLGQWPWLAAVLLEDRSTGGTHYGCDGVLICSKWVLTSARCLFDKDKRPIPKEEVSVVLATSNLVEASEHTQQFYALNAIVHELFNISAKKVKFDVAVIELNEAVAFNDYVRPACVRMVDAIDMSTRPSTEGIMLGWLVRKEEDVRLADQPVTTLKPGQARLRVSARDLCELFKPKEFNCGSDDIFHASGREATDKNCANVHAGSPLLMKTSKDRYRVAAVASYVEGCDVRKKSVMFTRMEPYIDWIMSTADFCVEDHI